MLLSTCLLKNAQGAIIMAGELTLRFTANKQLQSLINSNIRKGNCKRVDPSLWIKNTQSSYNVLLSRECIRGIGEDLLQKAFNIIDTHQEDNVEVSYGITS